MSDDDRAALLARIAALEREVARLKGGAMTRRLPERTTDENCQGECRCPMCGWVAYWSAHWKLHACADPNCRTEFREHNDERDVARLTGTDADPERSDYTDPDDE